MNSNKPPALTSPWKMGFFVSLMLVSVSIGVTYFFVEKTGVAFNWPDEWNWQDKNDWLGLVMGEGIIAEFLPLIAIVALSTLIASLVVSGGVRKYRRYLDSGLDYKNLLVSLKDINDILDTSKIEKMRHQPELKRFLLGISESVNARMKDLDARGNELERQADEELSAREEELTSEVTEQCDELTRAIENPVAGQLGAEIDISNPALKRVEHAVRSVMKSAVSRGGELEPCRCDRDDGSSYDELKKASDVLSRRLEEIVGEMKQSGTTAKEIEQQLCEWVPSEAELASMAEGAGGSTGAIGDTLKTIENLSSSLGAISEEAKGIAISTALSAGSGEGTQDDLIRLAEEVKDVSSRFKASSAKYAELTTKLEAAVNELGAAGSGDAGDIDPYSMAQSAASVQSKVSLWVERIVVLSDKMANFQESYSIAVGALPEADTSEAEPVAGAAEGSDASDEFSFESLDGSRSVFGNDTEESAQKVADDAGDRGMFGAMTPDGRDVTGSDSPALSDDEAGTKPMVPPEASIEDQQEETRKSVDEPVTEMAEAPEAPEEEPAAQQVEPDEWLDVPEEPVVSEQPVAAEEPVAPEQPAAVDEPVVSEQPAAVDEPVVSEQPAAAEEPVVPEQPVADEEPVVSEQPAAAEQPAAPQMMEGFETFSGPQPNDRPEKAGADVVPVDVERTESFRPEAQADRPDEQDAAVMDEEKVVDLYALGAVDYDPAVHG